MATIILPNRWRRQPTGTVDVSPEFAPYLSSVKSWRVPTAPEGFFQAGYTKAGTINPAGHPQGLGVKGDGSSGYYNRDISYVPAAGLWCMAVAVSPAANTTAKFAYGVGANAATGAFFGIVFGGNSSSAIQGNIRVQNNSLFQYMLGPTPAAGDLYASVFVVPTGTAADTYLYVNGTKYSGGAGDNISFASPSTYVYETAGALRRNTVGSYFAENVLLTARGTSIDEAAARELSVNPWQIFRPQTARIYSFPSGGAGVTGTASPTNAADTSTAAGTVGTVGSGTPTNAADTSTAAGTVGTVGTAAATNGADTATAAGTVGHVGSGTPTNEADTASGSGTAGTAVPAVTPAGGGRSKKRRRVMVNGRLYNVTNDELQALLAKLKDDAATQAAVAEALGDEELASEIKRKVVRLAKRVEKVDERAEKLRLLRNEDEQILSLFIVLLAA